jgi:multidrug efflux pump subunit AcrA (membrane-fusion protein)
MSQTITTWVNLDGRIRKVLLLPGGAVEVDGKPVAADIRILSPGVLSILLTLPDGTTRSFRCIADAGDDPAVLIDGRRIPYTIADPRSLRAISASAVHSGPRPLKSPMPGRIVRVLVAAGETVEAGQGCVVVEAMKMQNELKAPKAGIIGRLSAKVGETVAAGATLLIIE